MILAMSDIKDVMHETAKGLYKAGGLSLTTMREIDSLCLPPVKKYSAIQIKRLRIKNKASQPVFAAFLNISKSTIQKWETGQKKPNGPSLKLLNIVDQKGLEILA